MTDEELAAIKARVEATTPGPWGVQPEKAYPDSIPFSWIIRAGGVGSYGGPGRMNTRTDADFVAYARQDIPTLLVEVERLRGLVQREHDARLEIHREAETLHRERDDAEAKNAQYRTALDGMFDVADARESAVAGDRDSYRIIAERLMAQNAALHDLARMQLDALELTRPQLRGALVMTEVGRAITAARALLAAQQQQEHEASGEDGTP